MREGDAADDFSGFEFDLAESGMAVETGAFVEESVVVFEAFGEGVAVVGIDVDDLIGVSRDRGGGRLSHGGLSEQDGTADGERGDREEKRFHWGRGACGRCGGGQQASSQTPAQAMTPFFIAVWTISRMARTKSGCVPTVPQRRNSMPRSRAMAAASKSRS